ncbi:MAG: ABC transporter substrate-binding protein [Zoogloeaceae bacterium]|nr:ABC transporter substrate-binding protein [Zoogloeaceae bacterium]
MMKKKILGQFAGGILLGWALLGAAVAHGEEARRVVRYYGDQQATLPARVDKIAVMGAHNAMVAMLGYGPNIVATNRGVRDNMPIFRRFVPSITQAALISNGEPNAPGDLNIETLLHLKPDVIFMGNLPKTQVDLLEKSGIAIVALRHNSMQNLRERVAISGDILGDDARKRAEDYRAYFDANLAKVERILARIPAEKRLKIYHALNEPLTTSGRPSLNQDWMEMGGAINIAEHWFEGAANAVNTTGKVSMEAIVAANPDVIVTLRAADAAFIRRDPRWKNLNAVRNGRVYANPKGMYWWCRETPEEALQFLWLAKTLYPEAATEIDMKQETRAFYKRFYGYELSAADVAEFLEPKE